MTETPQAFPLQWPTWLPRTPATHRQPAKFVTAKEMWRDQGNGAGYRYRDRSPVSVAAARERLQREIDRLGATHVTLSTNVELRLDGQPRSDRREPDDPGAALYFMLRGKPICLPCDRWTRVADNITAIAKHIEALRGQDRWGVGTVEQAFAGYAALPPAGHIDWRAVLQLHRAEQVSRADVEQAFKRLAFDRHPDRGGSDSMMADLNLARDQALREVPS